MSEEKELIEVKLKEVIANNVGIETDKYRVTWKTQGKTSVDTDAMKSDGVYETYARRGETRVLRFSLNKGVK